MQTMVLIAAIVVVIVLLAAWWWYSQQKRREQLRSQFGPEYDRAVQETGSSSAAEKELASREKRVRQLDIKPLSGEQRSRYAESWRQVQARFVDDPSAAVGDADRLVGEVMQARGYPMGDFEQRAADISVDHPQVVDNYRNAHAIAQRQADGSASTEDLRQAMVFYRSLFNDLLGDAAPAGAANPSRRPEPSR